MDEIERIKNVLVVWSDMQGYKNLVKMLNGEESIEDYLNIVEKNAEKGLAKAEGKLEQILEDNKPEDVPSSSSFLEDDIKECKREIAQVKQWREKLSGQKQ